VHAAPAVSCAKLCKETHMSIQVQSEALRHSLRNGVTAYATLSPATNSSCHRHRRINGLAKPGWARKNLSRFDTSNGCQDHAVLPYAAARCRQKATPGFGVVVLRKRNRSRDKPPCDIGLTPTLPRPPHPVPTFVTMANAPLLGDETARLIVLICPTGEAEYFLARSGQGKSR
jgi:hypothetical protein